MSSLRLPVRLLGSVNASSAYPRELLADFANGDLILINTTGGQVKIPNAITVKTSGTGNAITGISANGKTLTLTKGSTFLTSHPTIAKSTDSTDSLSAAFGGKLSVIDSITRDSNGHVTKINTKSVTLPSAPTSVSGAAGSAAEFTVEKEIALTGDVTGSVSSKAGWSIDTTLKSLFTTAPGAVGPTANSSLGFSGTFTVPQVTVDKTGRVTAITARTLTMPAKPTPSLTVTSSGSGNFVKSISASGSTISYVKGSAASTVTYKVNIGTTWSGSAAPYTQTISVSGMLASDNPIVDVTPDSTYDTAVSQVEAWGNIHRITTAANSITVYANDKTEVAIPIQLKCIRG